MRISLAQIWKPDIKVHSHVGDTVGYLTNLDPMVLAQVHHSGVVIWNAEVHLESYCPVNTTYFPFDIQHCVITIGSWTYSTKYFIPKWIEKNATYPFPLLTTEWHIDDVILGKTYMYVYNSGSYPLLAVELILSRRLSFTGLAIMIPCVMLTLLTLVIFLLPANSGEKLNLGVAIWTSLVVFLLILIDLIPASSGKMPLLGLYNLIILMLVTISLLLSVVSAKLHVRDEPVPRWLHSLMVCYLAKLVLWKWPQNVALDSSTPGTGKTSNRNGESDSSNIVHDNDIPISFVSNGAYDWIEQKSDQTEQCNKSTEIELTNADIWQSICRIFDRVCFLLQLIILMTSICFIGVYWWKVP